MPPLKKSYFALGTLINLTVFAPATEADIKAAYQLIQHYEDLLTVNRPQSEVMAINHAAGQHAVVVSALVYQLVQTAVNVSLQQLGFNVAIGPLVKLWRIGFSDAHKPSDRAITTKLPLIDPQQIELNEQQHSVFLRQSGMELDLGAIAKGYIADAIRTLWQQRHVAQGIIDLGGNILLVGQQQWRVGIQAPQQQRGQMILRLTTTAAAVVTSGIYERHLQLDGHDYHHMFDSQTGYPIENNLASVTIIAPDSLTADIWTTIAFYQGLASSKLIAQQADLAAIYVTKNQQIYLTAGLKAKVELLDNAYQIQ
ncbi:FAD:protein FMN transferase [Loigolactobacillus jiayinensis]|uniref:FAD:protein FMN transferase n=1 Tax=Loigolactobacillus jiayinensis TaxID=2486016 RepID=A0ABW1RDH8_9LACO|nr:FAD:protein FMN transferase [Loigolactobacillus jiayinensis]